ncbi:MAG: FtsW/RodA/SpoVE family cell cycle protein, partial [Clostridia bacterium]|nr:FtsW/RodA/SpoVE family cell cycle protein [Clostridia bacterium]
MMSETRRNREGHFDWPLVVVVYALSIFGILCITMATYVPSVSEDLPLLNKILASRSGMWQSIFLVVSPIVIGVIVALPTQIIRSRTRLVYLGVLGLLVVTLVIGQVSNGLRGWLKSDLLGRSIQVSEFSKLSVMLMLAQQLARSEKPMSKFRDFMRTMIIVGVPALAVLAQGETGTVIVIAFMFLAMIYFAGVDIRIILAFIVLGVLGIGAIVAYGMLSETTDYRILRLLAFMDPEKYRQTGGYQILMSQKAIGAGQMRGVGTFVLGSWTTLGYVPESSTDSVFTVVGESFGFIGSVAVLAAYLYLVIRMLYLARFTQDKFGQLVIIGVILLLGAVGRGGAAHSTGGAQGGSVKTEKARVEYLERCGWT